MPTSKETFSQRVKRELAKNNYSPHERRALLCALLKQNGQLGIDGDQRTLEVRLKSASSLQMVYSMLKTEFNPTMRTSAEDSLRKSGYRIYELRIQSKIDEILSELHLASDVPPRSLLANKKVRTAYVIGVFLGGGYVSEPASSTPDLEIITANENMGILVLDILQERGFVLKGRIRRGAFVCYLKRADRIVDLLKLFNAVEATLAFEDARISRDLAWQLSKLNNIDIANQQKTISAAAQLISDIKLVNKAGLLKKMSPKTILFCKLRVAYPDYSLAMLCNEMSKRGTEVTKAGLNHYGRLIRSYAEELRSA